VSPVGRIGTRISAFRPTADKAGPVGGDGRLRVRDFYGIDVKRSSGVATNRPKQSAFQLLVFVGALQISWLITTASRLPAVSAAAMAAGSSSS
jgi:hypothetical protein